MEMQRTITLGAQSSYIVMYFEGSNAVKTTSICKETTTPLFCCTLLSFLEQLIFVHIIKSVRERADRSERLRESQMLSSVFPKYSIVMFVIVLRKRVILNAEIISAANSPGRVTRTLQQNLQKMPN